MSLASPLALSVAIPAHNEEKFIGRCIESVLRSAEHAGERVDIGVAVNRCTDRTQAIAESLGAHCVVNDTRCIAAVRNSAVRATQAPAVVTIDADSWMAPGTVAEVLRLVNQPRYIGGGSAMWPERFSVGILFSALSVLPYVVGRGVSAGMFWFQREAFETIGGFDERLITVEDVDFALRLKALGAQRGQRFGTLYRQGITTSCRKFDTFGDWYLFLNPRLVRQLFSGRHQKAADHFYYDVKR